MTVNFCESGIGILLSVANMSIAPEIEDRIILNSKNYFVQDRQFEFDKNDIKLNIFLECIG